MDQNKDVQVCEVIISTLLLRGNGKTDPYRRVTQVFTKSGDLIAEKDSETFTAMDLVHFTNFYNEDSACKIEHVRNWIDNLGK